MARRIIDLGTPGPSATGEFVGRALSGLGTGIAGGIKSILKSKIDQIQQQKAQKELHQQTQQLEEALSPLVGPEKAPALAMLASRDPRLIQSLLKYNSLFPEISGGQQEQQGSLLQQTENEPQPAQKTASKSPKDIAKIKKAVVPKIQAGEMTEEQAKEYLQNTGYDPDIANLIIAPNITPKIADFFMIQAKGKVKTAKMLARAYGFKV